MRSVLVIDDDPSIRLLVEAVLDPAAVQVHAAETAAAGLEAARAERPDAVLLDLLLPDRTGLELVDELRTLDPWLPVILITTHGSSHAAIEAMRRGAYDFLVKPLDLEELGQRLARALELRRLTAMPFDVCDTAELRAGSDGPLVGRSPAMRELYKEIGRLAAQDVAVLLRGESGTGKEAVARAIHHYSRRAECPFVTMACLSNDPARGDDELFGTATTPGKLKQCHDGVLFLEEVSELQLPTQTRLLQWMQTGTYEWNGQGPQSPNVRILAASTRDLEARVAAGQFRTDLYYLLSTFTVKLPPLRERKEDLPALCWHFVKGFNRELGKRVYRIAPEVLERFSHEPWPGNIRQLQSMLRQAVLHATGSVLVCDFLPAATVPETPAREEPVLPASEHTTEWETFVAERLASGSESLYEESLAVMERQVLTLVLRHTGGNRARAAKLLGMTRLSLRQRIRNLGIVIAQQTEVYPDEE